MKNIFSNFRKHLRFLHFILNISFIFVRNDENRTTEYKRIVYNNTR